MSNTVRRAMPRDREPRTLAQGSLEPLFRARARVAISRVAAFALMLCAVICAAEFCIMRECLAQGEAKPIVIRPVDPSKLATSSVDTDFAPATAKHVKAVFARYVQDADKSGTIAKLDSPTEFAKTVTGRAVNLKEIFVAINKLQASAEQSNKSLNDVAVSQKPVNLDALQARVKLAPNSAAVLLPLTLQGRQPLPAPSPPPPPAPVKASVPATAATCGPVAPHAALSLDDSWKQIQTLADSQTSAAPIDRCTLAFEPQLTEAESGTPKMQSSGEVSLTSITYGGFYASGNFKDAVKYSFAGDGDTLELTSALTGSVLGTNIPILSVNAALHAPSAGDSSATVSVVIGQQALYQIDNAVNPNQAFHVAPQKQINIMPSFRTSIKSLLNGTFEVDCVGSVGLDGVIRSNRYGLLLEATPKVHVALNGGVSASYILIDGSLSGELTLVDLSGQIGALAAVIPDPTAPQFDDSTFAPQHPPVIAIARPYASATLTALQGSVSVKLRIAGNFTIFSKTIPVTGGVKTLSRSLPDTWKVVYLLPPS